MKRLSRAQENERAKHLDKIRDCQTKMEEAVTLYNQKLIEAKTELENCLEALNSAITDASDWCEGIYSVQGDYAGERSDRWTESDNGQNYNSWMEEWGSELPQVEFELPEELDMPEVEAADNLEALPSEPS